MEALAVKSTRGAALERRLVRRSRLLDAIAGSARRTVLLVAPAGYGKTTLARQWLEVAGGSWVGLSTASADVPVLAREVGRALSDLRDFDLGRVEGALSAAKTPPDQAKAVAHAILAQIQTPLDGWIVLDDYHLLGHSPPAEDLIGLLERSGRLKLLVASRARPQWATSRRRVHLGTFEIGAAQLALDDEEVAELIPSSRKTAALKRQARGWPAVIALAAYADSSSIPSDINAFSARLYDYFAEELYEHAPEDVRRFLTTLAVLPPLDVADLDEILKGADTGVRVAGTGLAYESDGRIVVHPLAQAFLRSKLRAQEDALDVVT